MADEFNPTYTLNAGAVIAKLHLAGKMQARDFIVVNSAIENETSGDTPDKPGKCVFNTNIKKSFDISFINKQEVFTFYKQIKVEKIKEYNEYIKKNKNIDEQSKSDENINSQPKENSNKSNNDESLKKLIGIVTKYETKGKEIKKLKPDKSTFDDFKNAINEENQARAAEFKKSMDAILKKAISEINNYFVTFIGKEAFKKIGDPERLIVQYFDEKLNDISKVKVKDFQVFGMEESELKKLDDEFFKDQGKPTKVRIGFKVAVDMEAIGE